MASYRAGMPPVGYSGTPLPRKLGLREGDRLVLVGAPPNALELIAPLPAGVTVRRRLGAAELVVAFVEQRSELERRIDAFARAIFPNGGCWIAWPKRASGVPTDMTEDVIREVALPLGLVDTKVCAIDETWSGLRLVWRKELRSDRGPLSFDP